MIVINNVWNIQSSVLNIVSSCQLVLTMTINYSSAHWFYSVKKFLDFSSLSYSNSHSDIFFIILHSRMLKEFRTLRFKEWAFLILNLNQHHRWTFLQNIFSRYLNIHLSKTIDPLKIEYWSIFWDDNGMDELMRNFFPVPFEIWV